MSNQPIDDFPPDYGEDYEDERRSIDDEEDGCCFPGECVMPGHHRKSECHTSAMLRDFEREQMGTPDASDRKMPFGKHKGGRLRDIPTGYLDWCLGLDNLNADLRADIESHLSRQAEYHADWKGGREDYDPNED